MFQRFRARARRVIFFAGYEAGLAGRKSIMEWRLLLGLAREGRATIGQIVPAADALAAAAAVRSEVEKRSCGPSGAQHIATAHMLRGLMELPGAEALEILRGGRG